MKTISFFSLAALALAAAPRAQTSTFSQKPPGGLDPSKVPMMVCFGFDDNARVEGMMWFANLAKTRKNPAGSGNHATFDGDQVKGTFFITANYATGEGFVEQGASSVADVENTWKELYKDGHELGNHTWSHPHGAGYDLAAWKDEISKANTLLANTIGVDPKTIKGFRAPFLEYSPTTLEALKDLGFAYDCSIEFGFGGWTPLPGDTGYWNSMSNPDTHKKLFWPWALDNGSPPGNASKGDPKIAGLTEVPVYTYMKDGGGEVTGVDFNLWKIMDKATFVKTITKEFDLRRTGNRNPLVINMHSDYYTQYDDDANKEFTLASWQDRQKGLQEVLDYVLTFPETRVVTYSEMLAWMKSPVALDGEGGATVRTLNRAAQSLRLTAGNRVEIDLPGKGAYDLALATASGRVVARAHGRSETGKASLTPVAPLTPGVYFLRIGTGAKAQVLKAVLR